MTCSGLGKSSIGSLPPRDFVNRKDVGWLLLADWLDSSSVAFPCSCTSRLGFCNELFKVTQTLFSRYLELPASRTSVPSSTLTSGVPYWEEGLDFCLVELLARDTSSA